MPAYLIRADSGWQWPATPDRPHNTALVGKFVNDDNAWLVVTDSNPVDDYSIDGLVIGAWNLDGSNYLDDNGDIVHPVTNDYYELRPLGNEPDGKATSQLRYSHAAGWKQRWLREDWFYPVQNDTMTIETRHKFYDSPAPQAGWGYRSEIRYAGRTPGNRNMGIYNDEDCQDFRYNGGAFQLGDSEWYFDDDTGVPEEVWFSENTAAQTEPDKQDIHHALISAGNQEGHGTLWADEDSVTFNFWQNDLGTLVRVLFIDQMNAIPSVLVTENGFNRVEIKKGPEKVQPTFAQIINRRVHQASPELRTIIYTVGEEVGLIPPETP